MLVVKYEDLERLLNRTMERARAEALRQARDEEQLIDVEEVLRTLQISRSTLSRWQKSGYIKTVSVGGRAKFHLSEVKQLMKEGR